MPTTNLRLVNTEVSTIAATAACGVSAVVSVALSSPGGIVTPGGKFILNITNPTTTVPLHIEVRSLWTDITGTEQTTKITQFLASNDETYGNSALVPQSLLLLKSGVNMQIAFEPIGGSAFNIAVMAASGNITSAVSSMLQLWQV